jgi:hypothetical protein
MSDIFSPAHLQQAAHASLADAFQAIPNGKRGALIIVTDQDGARALVAAKLGAHWQLAGGADKPWTGPITGQIVVAGAW